MIDDPTLERGASFQQEETREIYGRVSGTELQEVFGRMDGCVPEPFQASKSTRKQHIDEHVFFAWFPGFSKRLLMFLMRAVDTQNANALVVGYIV